MVREREGSFFVPDKTQASRIDWSMANWREASFYVPDKTLLSQGPFLRACYGTFEVTVGDRSEKGGEAR